MNKIVIGNIILILLAILGLILYYIYPYWVPYFDRVARKKYHVETTSKIELYNKTGDKNILEQIYKNFHNDDWYFPLESVGCLAYIDESKMNEKIEIKLAELFYEPSSDNPLKMQILDTLLHFNLKSKQALDVLISCLDDWNTFSANDVAQYIVKQKIMLEEVVINSYKKNVTDNPKSLVTAEVYNTFYADERYKELFDKHNLLPPKPGKTINVNLK